MKAADREPVAIELDPELVERVLDLVVGVRIERKVGALEPTLPGGGPVGDRQQQDARGLEDAPDLGEDEIALVHVLEQVEAEHHVETRGGDRKPLLDIGRDEGHVRHPEPLGRPEPDPERCEVGVDAGDVHASPCGLERVHPVAAPDVEQRGPGSQMLQVPVVLRRVAQKVLGMDVLATLSRPPREPNREPLGLGVGEEGGREDGALEPPAHRVRRIAT